MEKKTNLKNFIFWTATFLLIVGVALTPMPGSVGAQEEESLDEFLLEDTVVTATRRAQAITDVPLSVTAFGVGQIEAQGLKQIDDLAPFTPGLVVQRVFNGANRIFIRGISSGSGAATTGIYLDDTPIQARNLGYGSGSAFPGLFDLERVEVLRGPQGTLFGAGSEGGTVRFIQTAPNLDEPSAYVRGEYSSTKGGDISYEVGAAYGAPIVEGKLGFRISAYHREDGGWIDGVKGTPVLLDPTGDVGPASLTFTDVTVTRPDSNSINTTGWRAALKWAPTDSLEITPSVSYQKLEVNDGLNVFWESVSGGGEYAKLVFEAGDPATNPHLSTLTYPNEESGEDEFYLPALAINWDLGNVEVFSNTSYYDRDYVQYFEFTMLYAWMWNPPWPDYGFFPRPGDKGMTEYTITQKNFTQEIRIQSTDDSARLRWVAGLFYAHAKQTGDQQVALNILANAPEIAMFWWPGAPSVTDGPPFGPGSTAFENWFGVSPEPDSDYWGIDFSTKDTQLAGFAQIDYDITEDLTLTAGLRVARTEMDFYSQYEYAFNNQNSPMGMAGPVLPPRWESVIEQYKETMNSPKIGLSYDIDDDNMIYVNIAKGFRPPGATNMIPLTGCTAGLIRLGYVDENDNPCQPTTFDSDYVWSYEIGTKNSLFNNRLTIDASAYLIDWTDIQSGVFVQECAEGFTTNLGEARSQGFDLGFQLYPTDSLMITGTVGYNKSEFTKDAMSPGGVVIYSDGAVVPGSPPPWLYSLSAHHNFSLMDRPFYWRVDFVHNTEQRPVGNTDPSDPNYNADLAPVESYSTVNARIGALWGRLDVSLFAKNLTNADPSLGLANNVLYTGNRRFVWQNQTLRPRTIGIFASYRY